MDQKMLMWSIIGMAVILFTIAMLLVYRKEKFNGYYKVGPGYLNPNPLVLPPNPPTPDWFLPDTYNRPMHQSGMEFTSTTFKGRPYQQVGYTDDRAWLVQ